MNICQVQKVADLHSDAGHQERPASLPPLSTAPLTTGPEAKENKTEKEE